MVGRACWIYTSGYVQREIAVQESLKKKIEELRQAKIANLDEKLRNKIDRDTFYNNLYRQASTNAHLTSLCTLYVAFTNRTKQFDHVLNFSDKSLFTSTPIIKHLNQIGSVVTKTAVDKSKLTKNAAVSSRAAVFNHSKPKARGYKDLFNLSKNNNG